MIVGTTGSRYPRPESVCQKFRAYLLETGATELHHGDCKGWDAQAHHIAASLGIKTVAHPPDVSAMRAHCDAEEVRAPLPYLKRNAEIVLSCDALFAAPEGPERLRSGTWATVRKARNSGKPVFISEGAEMTNYTPIQEQRIAECMTLFRQRHSPGQDPGVTWASIKQDYNRSEGELLEAKRRIEEGK